MTEHPNGAIFYRGRSLLDNAPIVGIVTGLARPSHNPKTGDMLQTFILRSRISPVDAVTSGRDSSICGDCKLRGTSAADRTCYVTVFQAPLAVYCAYRRGNYAPLDLDSIRGRAIRLGAYGDPAAIPTHVWQMLLTGASTWTGYTHQWRTADPQLRKIIMASVDSEDERVVADALGWRTFRVRPTTDDPIDHESEVVCPASAEAGYRTDCEHCGLCQGQHRPAKSVVIAAHGARRKLFPLQVIR